MKDLVTRIVTGIIGLGLFAGVWFAIAGRLTWWQGWVFLFSFVAYASVLVWRLSKLNLHYRTLSARTGI
jgi:hypothetical protein